MTWDQGIVLGIVQGLTEFLPVSSSGHLVLGQYILGVEAATSLTFELLVHLGTLLAVVVVYRRELATLAWYALGEGPGRWRREGFARGVWADEQGRFLCAIVIITIITGALGLALKDTITPLFQNVQAVGIALMITAVLLSLSFFARERYVGFAAIPLWAMVAVGVAQSLAITPGISRSGATIAVALLAGVDRRSAGALSFIASIPAIVGASLLEIDSEALAGEALAPGLGGLVAAALAGWLALTLLLAFVRQGRLYWFAPYCLAVGVWALFG